VPGGAFEVSFVDEFDLDALRTAEEIDRCGADALEAMAHWVEEGDTPPVNLDLVADIHWRWFHTTFPNEAGQFRHTHVNNRKATAATVPEIIPGIGQACGNWTWRHENLMPDDDLERVEFVVAEANTLAVHVYDIHPFVDGNTRTTWHLRNYALMLGGLRPLTGLVDEETHMNAWWAATPHAHAELDAAVLTELDAHDR
jgi:fido (protein-threonine AMPylation protein)